MQLAAMVQWFSIEGCGSSDSGSNPGRGLAEPMYAVQVNWIKPKSRGDKKLAEEEE